METLLLIHRLTHLLLFFYLIDPYSIWQYVASLLKCQGINVLPTYLCLPRLNHASLLHNLMGDSREPSILFGSQAQMLDRRCATHSNNELAPIWRESKSGRPLQNRGKLIARRFYFVPTPSSSSAGTNRPSGPSNWLDACLTSSRQRS